MGLREIPALSTLCLRAIGSPKCQVDATFKPQPDGSPSTASRLLRSFHHRPVLPSGQTVQEYVAKETEAISDLLDPSVPTLERIPMQRTPAIGAGSGRRKQANDVDLNHPWIAAYLPRVDLDEDEDNDSDNDEATEGEKPSSEQPRDSTIRPKEQLLVGESGSCALDLLQSYIDALVEMGRMDDNRLGIQFFHEVRTNIELAHQTSLPLPKNDSGETEAAAKEAEPSPSEATPAEAPPPPAPPDIVSAPIPKKKKRKRSGGGPFSAAKKKKEAEARAAAEAKKRAAILAAVPRSRGCLSLHNCEVLRETTTNLLSSRVLEHVHVLDLTGLQTLTDATLLSLLQSAGLQLERLSVKNCRRLTDESIHGICATSEHLKAIDLGGCYNLKPSTLVEALALQTHKRGRGIFTSLALPRLVELHAGGIGPTGGWTDDLLPSLFALRGWRALSIGFSPALTFAGWKAALLSVEHKHARSSSAPVAEPDGGSPEGAAANGGGSNGSSSSYQPANMCHTLQSLGIAFCEQQLVDNAWLGLVGRHLPNLRALDVRGNHQLHSMTSWYDGRATISNTSHGSHARIRVNPKQSLMVLARYSGISQKSIDETKQIYPLAASPLEVSTESDGIGWGILRQEAAPKEGFREHYRKRIEAAKKRTIEEEEARKKKEAQKAEQAKQKAKEEAAPKKEGGGEAPAAVNPTPPPPPPSQQAAASSMETDTKVVTVVPPEEDAVVAPAEAAASVTSSEAPAAKDAPEKSDAVADASAADTPAVDASEPSKATEASIEPVAEAKQDTVAAPAPDSSTPVPMDTSSTS